MPETTITTKTHISIRSNAHGGEWVLILRARYSGPRADTCTNGADVDTYDIRCVQLETTDTSTPIGVSADARQIVISLGETATETEVADAACKISDSGIMATIFERRTEAGHNAARVIDHDAMATVLRLILPAAKAGRPSIGPAIKLRLPRELLDQLTERAAAAAVDRTEFIRRVLRIHLSADQAGKALAAACDIDRGATPEAHFAYLRRIQEIHTQFADDVDGGPDWLRGIASDAEALASLRVDLHLLRNPQLGRPCGEMAELFEAQ